MSYWLFEDKYRSKILINFFCFISIFFSFCLDAHATDTEQQALSFTFSYFKNLYFEERSNVFFSNSNSVHLQQSVNTQIKRGYRWRNYNPIYSMKKNIVVVDGTTIIIMEKPVTNWFISHFFHFLEHLVGIWDNFQKLNCPDVKLVLLASDGNYFNFDWRGPNQVTEHILKALFPSAKIMTLQEFKKANKNSVIRFQEVLTSDRAKESNCCTPFFMARMLNLYHQNLDKKNIALMDEILKKYFNIIDIPKLNQLNITYLKRDRFRTIEKNIENELIKKIEEIKNVKLECVDFAKLSFKRQLEIVHNTDIFLGAHGNGFSHVLFLKPGATVIEFFPSHSLRCEYRVFSNLKDLNYFAWIDNEGLFNYEELKNASEKGVCGQHNDKNLYLIKPEISRIINLVEDEVDQKICSLDLN